MRMRNLFASLAAGAALFLAAPAYAVVDSAFGVKGGLLSFDGDATAATQAGLVYSIDLAGLLGVEFEFNTTLADGDAGFSTDYTATQLGAYGVLMSPGPIYIKGKAGYVRTELDFDGIGSDEDTDLAYGLGIGFEALAALEVEYTRTKWNDIDVDFISVSFKF